MWVAIATVTAFVAVFGMFSFPQHAITIGVLAAVVIMTIGTFDLYINTRQPKIKYDTWHLQACYGKGCNCECHCHREMAN